jgi:hypothetical protein
MKELVVRATWDVEAKAWIAFSDDLPGLAIEHADFDQVMEILLDLGPDLVISNLKLDPKDVTFHLIAERDLLVAAE